MRLRIGQIAREVSIQGLHEQVSEPLTHVLGNAHSLGHLLWSRRCRRRLAPYYVAHILALHLSKRFFDLRWRACSTVRVQLLVDMPLERPFLTMLSTEAVRILAASWSRKYLRIRWYKAHSLSRKGVFQKRGLWRRWDYIGGHEIYARDPDLNGDQIVLSLFSWISNFEGALEAMSFVFRAWFHHFLDLFKSWWGA